MEEPSVLDYVKSKLMPWRGQRIEIPAAQDAGEGEPGSEANLAAEPDLQPGGQSAFESAPLPAAGPERQPLNLPWRVLCALALALLAQVMLEPPERSLAAGALLYLAAAAMSIWALVIKEWRISEPVEDSAGPMPVAVNAKALLFMVTAAVLAFIGFGGNRFTVVNLFLWAMAIGYMFWALWVPSHRWQPGALRQKLAAFFKEPVLNLRITPWGVLVAACIVLVIFLRVGDLDGIPNEMISDHAEKLLDVNDVLNGETSIFFIRNTGREFVQMYLTAALARLSPEGLSFLILKLGTVLAGLLTLPFIYLLGKEVGGKWVGFAAFLMAGAAYWPNVIARIGLRFPLYPLFTAPMLYFLVRGLARQNRNNFIWAGIALGLGLQGYSPMRIVPFLVMLLVVLYLAHRQAKGKAVGVMVALGILALCALVIFLPTARFALDDPEMFGVRAFSRLGTIERDYPGPVLQIFLSNFVKAWFMPWWDNGEIWVHSIPHRPALDAVSAAMYMLGTIWLVARYIRRRHWLDLFLLVLVPLLMLPSTLSLAFPAENPSLNRTAAAYIPVFIIAALGLKTAVESLVSRATSISGKVAVALAVGFLAFWSISQNYQLVFDQFKAQMINNTWNTSQLAGVIRQFTTTIGTPESAHVVPYPHWVDTRVVGIRSGDITRDYALWPSDFNRTISETGPQLFLVKPEDVDALAQLRQLYPLGQASNYFSGLPGKDFVVFFVPAAKR